jgi:HSP20 family molecular chaperone IbpA
MKPTPIVIVQVQSKQSTAQILVDKMNCLLNKVRARAYEIFERRGRDDGYDVDDWLRAEAELGALQAAQAECTGTGIRLRIDRSELSSERLKIYAESRAITVECSAAQTDVDEGTQNWTERTFFGRYELPVAINAESVTASLKGGVLEIAARTAKSAAEKLPSEAIESAPLKTQPKKEKSVVA